MLELLNSLVQAVISIFLFITNTIKSTISLLLQIPQYVNFLSTAISTAPPFLLPFFAISISLSVMIFILNKD